MRNFFSRFSSSKDFVLVISWWWARWAYALGILHGMEKLGLDKNIRAIYGVSAWAIVWSYIAAGYTARETYEKFVDFFSFGIRKFNLLPKKWLLSNKFLRKNFSQDLPKTFQELDIPLYIGTTDMKKAEFVIFEKDELVEPLLGSMSIPGIFEPVPFKDMLLMDGGLIDNFPADRAKKKFPSSQIVGIALNKFKENQSLKTIFDALNISFEILLRAQTLEKFPLVDHLFYKPLPVGVMDIKEKALRKIFQEGYDDCIEHFRK